MIKPRRFITVEDGVPVVSKFKDMRDSSRLDGTGEVKTKRCQYRGEKIGEGTCELCGNRGGKEPIYQCEKHGTCVQRQYKKQRSQQEEAICLGCPDGPWSA